MIISQSWEKKSVVFLAILRDIIFHRILDFYYVISKNVGQLKALEFDCISGLTYAGQVLEFEQNNAKVQNICSVKIEKYRNE